MKNFLILMALGLLAFSGCSTQESTGDYSPGTPPEDLKMESTVDTSDLDPYQDKEPTGDYDLGAPEDQEVESTVDTSGLDPYQ